MGTPDAKARVLGVGRRFALLLVVAAACSQTHGNDYGTAAVALGGTVLATGAHRVATGSCWGTCAKGFYCDHESGLCERGECDVSCREGDDCVRESSGEFRCVTRAGTIMIVQPPADAGTDAS